MRQKKFSFENTAESQDSASVIVEVLWDFFSDCSSFIDLGCGMGAWTAEFEKRGLSDFVSTDHPTTPIEKLQFQGKKNFFSCDLDLDLPPNGYFDFGICIEVLEHFNQERADLLANYLGGVTDLLLFSAAIPHQKGHGHINERRHSFWHKKFKSLGFDFYDGFKPQLFPYVDSVKFFHIQNLFIYYRGKQKEKFSKLENISSLDFELVSTKILTKPPTITELLQELPGALHRSISHRLRKSNK